MEATEVPTIEAEIVSYQASKCVKARNRIVERSMPVVHLFADRMVKRSRFNGILEYGDFVTLGAMGLMQAIESFDPNRGFKFSTHVVARVRGAMSDAARGQDWTPRLELQRRKAINALRAELGRDPTWSEVDNRAKTPRSKKPNTPVSDFRLIQTTSYDRTVTVRERGGAYRELRYIDLMSDPAADQGGRAFEDRETFDSLIRCLPKTMRDVITLYYREQLTMREIGNSIGITESYVSILRKDALNILRANVKASAA